MLRGAARLPFICRLPFITLKMTVKMFGIRPPAPAVTLEALVRDTVAAADAAEAAAIAAVSLRAGGSAAASAAAYAAAFTASTAATSSIGGGGSGGGGGGGGGGNGGGMPAGRVEYIIELGVPAELLRRVDEATAAAEAAEAEADSCMSDGLIRVVPLMFTQGINEWQSVSNQLHAGASRRQREINLLSVRALALYFHAFVAHARGPAAAAAAAGATAAAAAGAAATTAGAAAEAEEAAVAVGERVEDWEDHLMIVAKYLKVGKCNGKLSSHPSIDLFISSVT